MTPPVPGGEAAAARTQRKNRITVEIYYATDAEARSSNGAHWVTITGQGGCELTLWARTAEHAARIAAAINNEEPKS